MRAQAGKHIRIFASQAYATSSLSIAEIARHPVFSVVPQATLEKWSLADKWVDLRQEFQEKTKRRIQNVLANEVVQERSNQLQEMVVLRDKLYNRIINQIDKLPEEDNIATLLNAFSKLAELSDRFMQDLSEVIVPAAFPEGEGDVMRPVSVVKPQLTMEEARAAARLLTRMRREEQLRLSGGGTGDERQPLRVIDGE